MRLLATALLLLFVNGVPEEPGVSGYVLAPEGTPVSGGTVVARSGLAATTAAIERTGRFRFVPSRAGPFRLLVTVPGLAPYGLDIIVPPSRFMQLPVTRLAAGAYFRVRLVTPAGEPIMAPQLRRRLFDASGRPSFDELDDRVADPAGSDGAITIGPLPRGILTAAVDMPFFARTRLPDVAVGDATNSLDGGTITIQQPGAVLEVDVVDGGGAAVPNHDVYLADPRPRTPLVFPPVRTNREGRATFDRLAPGRYRVSSPAIDRCGNAAGLTASRVVAVPDSGAVETPLVVGGRATFRITSPLGPAGGVSITAAPNAAPIPLPFGIRPRAGGCRGTTDANGRVTLTNFPPGPAHVDVQMANSTYVRQVEVPSDGHELAIAIPEGFLPVRVVDATTNQPVTRATVTWTGSGGRVEATPTASGDALLEGVGTAAGTLAASAQGYQPADEHLAEPPGIPHTIALAPLPAATRVRCRVIAMSGEPVPNAVVELVPANGADVPQVAVTDARGVVTFPELPSGGSQLIASADGFVTSTMRIGSGRGDVVLTLSPGYRAIASVELPATAGPQLVRILSDGNRSMESILDGQSDRRVEPPARLSLGALPPGAYVLELEGAGGRRTERIRIIDRDVYVTFR